MFTKKYPLYDIVVKSQKELDALPDKFDEAHRIVIDTPADVWVQLTRKWESAHVVARGSAHVVARESAHVVARGSAHVEAWESAHVEAYGMVAVHVLSEYANILLFGFAMCMNVVKSKKILKKSRTTTIIVPKLETGTKAWLEREGLKTEDGKVILFKRVSKDLKTQEGTSRETDWTPGRTLEHEAWDPKKEECGAGKFHACSTAFFCDEFRSNQGDRYVAIKIAIKDIYVWDPKTAGYPHKVAFRAGKVLHECNRFGKKV